MRSATSCNNAFRPVSRAYAPCMARRMFSASRTAVALAIALPEGHGHRDALPVAQHDDLDRIPRLVRAEGVRHVIEIAHGLVADPRDDIAAADAAFLRGTAGAHAGEPDPAR